MSAEAIEYVRARNLTDPHAARVFMLLAERTRPSAGPSGEPQYAMGLELRDVEIPALAATIGLTAEEFRRQLRGLKAAVPMDVLEHGDGVWEIVYGSAYTDPKPAPMARFDEANLPQTRAFAFPGWDRFSTWGRESPGHGHLYARLYLNTDDRDAKPRILIAPPHHVVRTVDELAAAIAEAIAPYQAALPPPPEVIRLFLTK